MKAKYTYSWPSEPVLTVASPGLFRLEQPWRCTRTAQDGSEKTWTVPAGFVTDFASIPRLFWSVQGFPMDRYHLHASLLHDWRYAQGGGKSERKDADKDYRRMLRQAGLGPVKACREYRTLRLFGASHFASPRSPLPAPAGTAPQISAS